MQEETLDKLIYIYLERQRYQGASQSLKQEAPALRGDMTLAPSLDSTRGMISQLVFHLVGDNDAAKYVSSFDQLAWWVDKSLDMYKGELQRLLYPIYLHCYLELINLNASAEGLELMARHRKRFAASKSRQQELDDLRNVVTREQLATNPIARNARGKPFPVRLSTYSQQLLFNFLHGAGLLLIVGIINDRLKLQVVDRQPAGQADEEAEAGGSLLTGQLSEEAATVNKRPLNLLLLQGKVEDDVPEAVAAAEGEEVEEDGKPQPSKKQKAASQKAADKEKAARAAALASRREPEIPLLPPTEDWEAAMLEDFKHRVNLGSSVQPSCMFFTFVNTADTLNCSAFAQDGSSIAGGFADSSVRLYDFERMAAARELPRAKRGDGGVHIMHGHADAVYGLSYSPDRRYLLSASGDGTVRFWSTEMAANLAVYRGHIFPVWDVAICPFDHYFASASSDRTARIWCTERLQPLRVMAGHSSDVDVVRWHPNAHYVATGSSDRTVRLWDLRDGATQRLLLGHQAAITSLAMAPDGKTLASADVEGIVMLWDLGEGRRIASLTSHKGPVWSMDFSQGDGALLATGSADQTICLWKVGLAASSGSLAGKGSGMGGTQQTAKLRTKLTPVSAVAFTSRNLLLGAGSMVVPGRLKAP